MGEKDGRRRGLEGGKEDRMEGGEGWERRMGGGEGWTEGG